MDAEQSSEYNHRFYFLRTTDKGPYYLVRYAYGSAEPDIQETIADSAGREIIRKGVIPRQQILERFEMLQALAANANESGISVPDLEDRLTALTSGWNADSN